MACQITRIHTYVECTYRADKLRIVNTTLTIGARAHSARTEVNRCSVSLSVSVINRWASVAFVDLECYATHKGIVVSGTHIKMLPSSPKAALWRLFKLHLIARNALTLPWQKKTAHRWDSALIKMLTSYKKWETRPVIKISKSAIDCELEALSSRLCKTKTMPKFASVRLRDISLSLTHSQVAREVTDFQNMQPLQALNEKRIVDIIFGGGKGNLTSHVMSLL